MGQKFCAFGRAGNNSAPEAMGVEEFNKMLVEFLSELAQVFPEHPELQTYKTVTEQMVKSQPNTPSQMYLSATKSHGMKIMQRDPTFFDDCPQILKVDVRGLWQKDLSDTTRNVIWMYLAELHALAATSSLPADTMSKLTDMAQDVSALIQNGQLDPTQLLGMLGMKTPDNLL